MKLLFVGALTSFLCENYILAFAKRGHKVTALDVSHGTFYEDLHLPGGYRAHVMNLHQHVQDDWIRNRKLPTAVLNAWRRYSGIYRSELKAFLSTVLPQFDVVYVAWGPFYFDLVRIFMGVKDRPPIVYDLGAYPYDSTTEVGHGLPALTKDELHVLPRLEGRIFGSSRMLDYARSRFDLTYGSNLVYMTHYCQEYFPQQRIPKLSAVDGDPHVVFVGRTDFEERAQGFPHDDVRPMITAYCREGIYIHLSGNRDRNPGESIEMFAEQEKRRMGLEHLDRYLRVEDRYKPMGGALSTYMTQFDACLVLYNLQKQTYRFVNSMCTRFSFALTAGIPVSLPAGVLSACEDIAKEHQIGFAFSDAKDLKRQLADRETMGKYARNALEKQDSFMYEKHIHKIEQVMENIIDDRNRHRE